MDLHAAIYLLRLANITCSVTANACLHIADIVAFMGQADINYVNGMGPRVAVELYCIVQGH